MLINPARGKRMAEKEQATNPIPDFTVRRRKRKQTVVERTASKKRRIKQEVFPCWRELRDLKGLQSNAILAVNLMDR